MVVVEMPGMYIGLLKTYTFSHHQLWHNLTKEEAPHWTSKKEISHTDHTDATEAT